MFDSLCPRWFCRAGLAPAAAIWIGTAWLILTPSFVIAAAGPLTLEYRGKVRLNTDSADDQFKTPFKITGLSGITNLGNDIYVSQMDNSGHLVAMKVTFKDDGTIADAKVTGGLTIAPPRDYEGIAYTNAARNSVFLSNEATPPPPALYEYSLKDGKLLQTVPMPAAFMYQVDNRGLESLTRRADGSEMWTANEEALTVDGPVSTSAAGTVVRLVRFTVDGNTLTPAQQYAYEVEPIHKGLGKAYSSGLSDMVVLDDGTLLTLERSAVEGIPTFETRIYQVDFIGATDISRGPLAEGLKGQTYTPVKKTLLLRTSKIGENLEGLCLGPKLPSGNRVLLGVVDGNNSDINDPISKNTLASFELIEPAPISMTTILSAVGGAVLLIVILLAAALLRRRRKG